MLANKPSSMSINREIVDCIRSGQITYAEMLLRLLLRESPNNPSAFFLLGEIAMQLSQPSFAAQYFQKAIKLAPEWELPRQQLPQAKKQARRNKPKPRPRANKAVKADEVRRFLLIKAWGHGFWSDVGHVVGQLLVAELTNRTPVVHWGDNSLFSSGNGENAFGDFFEDVSDFKLEDLQRANFGFFPPKWNHQNLAIPELNKMEGQDSRISGLHFLTREEPVIISDFYTSVLELTPWIPPSSPLFGLDVDQIYSYLFDKYIRPNEKIRNKVDEFYDKNLIGCNYISVHIRGSDKIGESTNLHETNGSKYKPIIDKLLAEGDIDKIFIMTDDTRWLENFTKTYGDKCVYTAAHRVSGDTGVHFSAETDGSELGSEIMIDTYLALRGNKFVGNGRSNPSLMIKYLKKWNDGDYHLIGKSFLHLYDHLILHRR